MRRKGSIWIGMALTIVMMSTTVLGCSQSGASDNNGGNANASGKEEGGNGSAKPVKFEILLRAGSEFTPENNPWVDEINEKANADITWNAVPIANVWEKRNVLMASGDYPEVIIMNPPADNMYEEMVKNGVLLPLNDYLEDAPNLMKYTNPASLESVREEDGSIYMIPRSTIVREDFMGIRKDWLDKLNLETPETIDDWREFFKAVATGDPDGNGKADTYGITESNEMMSMNGTINLEYFARAWHADKQWYDDGKGGVFYGVFAKDGRFKNALEFYRELVEDKSMDPDMITNKGIAAKEDKFNRGVTSAMRMFAGKLDSYLNVIRNIQPEAEIELVDFPTAPDSEAYKDEKLILTNSGVYNAWALTNKAKGKEKEIIRVFDWMLGDEGWNVLKNGVEGVQYKQENGEMVKLEPEYGNFSKWIGHLMMFRRPNDEDLWLKKLVPEVYPYQKEWLDKSVSYVNDNYQQDGLLGLVSDKQTEFYKKDIYTKEFVEVVAQIIFGELPLSAWDEFLDKVYASGWEEVTQEYNEYYQSHR
ncbi:extracellular solute-binding protein [Paenibacillus sp. HB172176]|uniref:extracellular solute-binding protein n=1 Tax=Paenibacillus sp. HB172176 TaxID=2493690 RepID=UPI00143C6695|nr:extracellular solute-binding protein [Paenibacillus sp. HB172176]